MKRIFTLLLSLLLVLSLASCGGTEQQNPSAPSEPAQVSDQIAAPTDNAQPEIAPPEEFILISGGTFQMGSLESEAWRSEDETAHAITVSDFYISKFELTQAEYQAVMGENPSSFTDDDLPVESISWMDAIQYCNTRSTQEGLTPAYTVDGLHGFQVAADLLYPAGLHRFHHQNRDRSAAALLALRQVKAQRQDVLIGQPKVIVEYGIQLGAVIVLAHVADDGVNQLLLGLQLLGGVGQRVSVAVKPGGVVAVLGRLLIGAGTASPAAAETVPMLDKS